MTSPDYVMVERDCYRLVTVLRLGEADVPASLVALAGHIGAAARQRGARPQVQVYAPPGTYQAPVWRDLIRELGQSHRLTVRTV